MRFLLFCIARNIWLCYNKKDYGLRNVPRPLKSMFYSAKYIVQLFRRTQSKMKKEKRYV